MTAAAVISLRGLPMMAQEELTMFFYIFFATFLFLIPAALVGAELGSAFASKGGGVYTWVKEAFNKHMGFTAIFLQWIQNVVWYPTVLGFAAASIAYMIGMPDLAQNGLFVGLFSIAMYWCATLVTLRGTSAISGITSKGFLIGTVLPGIVVIVMAVVWMIGGNSVALEHIPDTVSQVVNIDAAHHVHPRLFPHITGMSDIAFLAGILLLFAGVEVHAVHAPELKKPQTQFPRAMFLAALISFGLFTLGALAVAIITPYDQINLQSGLFTTFQIVFEHYHVGWLTNVMGLLVAFGALAGVMSWISGPSRGLLWTAQEGVLPCFLQKTNKNGVQINILIIQGCIVTLLSSLYIVMNDVSVAFFLLSALTVGLYLLMYMMMYAAGIRLRYTQPDLHAATAYRAAMRACGWSAASDSSRCSSRSSSPSSRPRNCPSAVPPCIRGWWSSARRSSSPSRSSSVSSWTAGPPARRTSHPADNRSGTAGTGTSPENFLTLLPSRPMRRGRKKFLHAAEGGRTPCGPQRSPRKGRFHRLGTFFRNIIFFIPFFFNFV